MSVKQELVRPRALTVPAAVPSRTNAARATDFRVHRYTGGVGG